MSIEVKGRQAESSRCDQRHWLHVQLHTRAATLPGYVSSAEQLMETAMQLLRPELPITVRLMGIRYGFSAFHARCPYLSFASCLTLWQGESRLFVSLDHVFPHMWLQLQPGLATNVQGCFGIILKAVH